MSAKRLSTFGMLVALAFIFSYIELLVPFHFIVPGMKLGLANIVVVTALYLLGPRDALTISFVRIVLVAFTFGNLNTMIYSLAGGALSFIAMAMAKKIGTFSVIGVSVLGAVFHNIGQIFVAMFMLETKTLVNYLPFLVIMSLVTGVLIGIVGGELTKRLKMRW